MLAAVRTRVSAENTRRKATGEPQLDLPGKETIRRRIGEMECRETYAEKYGEDAARRKYDGSGRGISASRILQVALMDDTVLDLVTCLDADRGMIAGRPYLCTLMDVHSRAILGLTLSFQPPSVETAAETIRTAIQCIRVANSPKRGIRPDRLARYPGLATLNGKGEYQTGVRNSAPSYAGKSASADEFARIVAARGTYPVGTLPVVRVELEQACTSKRFWTAILEKYGDGFARSKDEDALRRSAYDAFEKHGTRLLIIDEVQHAGYRSAGSSAPTDVIKRFISDKQVALGLFGNEDAATLLASNDQLSNRLQAPCDIQPLRLNETESQKIFEKFVRRYDAALESNSIFSTSSNLADPRVINCIMMISKGYLGRVVKLLQVAARNAHKRSASRIEVVDLSLATIRWAVQQNLVAYDPFTYGVVKNDG